MICCLNKKNKKCVISYKIPKLKLTYEEIIVKTSSNEIDKECIICLEDTKTCEKNNIFLCENCKKIYHKDCIAIWNAYSDEIKCPTCTIDSKYFKDH